ncbi:MAG TPA: tetratricopeptide repeat protein [Desulfobaccales bacterium]|nr:tetratricopeptide repeat protein [Desulfobaccales bacterium]
MMRNGRKYVIFAVAAALCLCMAMPVLAQPKGGALMKKDVFTPIAMGYKFIQEGKYAAAKHEFEIAVKRDPGNSFALNNMAVLEERAGHLNDALALLQDATKHANAYLDKVSQTCFVGGGCLAVKPLREKGSKSTIAPIVQENIKKLEAKIAATKHPAPPVTPPKMTPTPPQQKAK